MLPAVKNASLIRRLFLALAIPALLSPGPLAGQTVYDFVLDRITVEKFPRNCATGASLPSVTETFPAAASVTSTLLESCKGVSAKIDFTVNAQLNAGKATVDRYNVAVFDQGVHGSASVKATFSYAGPATSSITFQVPTWDLAPSASPIGQGTCATLRKDASSKGGEWTDSAGAPDCARSKKQSLTKAQDGALYYAAAWSTRCNAGSGSNVVNPVMQATLWYKARPAGVDKVTITSIDPPAGQRQDPGGVMWNKARVVEADIEYELGTRDTASLFLVVSDDKGSVLRISNEKLVARGKGTAHLQTRVADVPRTAVQILVDAQLIDKGDDLAKSPAVEYPVEIELRVDHAEAIQAVQDARNSIPLAANRRTRVRVYGVAKAVNMTGGVDLIPWAISGFRDGRELAGSPFLAGSEGAFIGADLDRDDPTTLYFEIPDSWTAPGTLDLRVEMNPKCPDHMNEKDPSDNVYNLKANFQERPRLDVRYRPICVEPPGQAPVCASDTHDGDDVLLALDRFGVQGDRVSYEALPLPPLRWPFPMTTSADWDRLIQNLQVFYRLDTKAGRSYQQVIGWLPSTSRAQLGDGGILRGLSFPVKDGGTGRAFVLSEKAADESQEGLAYLVAHEMGHNFGLTHPYPAPPCARSDASLVTGEINMILGTFHDSATYHLMSQCDIDGGIRPDQYLTVWRSGYDPPGAAPSTSSGASASKLRAAEAQGGECVLIQGAVSRQSAAGRFDSLLRVNCPEPPARPASGNHCLRFLDGAGAILGDWCFPVSFNLRETSGELDERGFYLEAPLPAGTQRLTLLRGEQELASRSASVNPPVVQFDAPRTGDRWSGGVMDVAWSASDPDGDTLSFTLQYSFDGGASWLPLEVGIAAPRFSLDTRFVQGGNNVKFRVIASDGFYSTAADVGPLEIVQAPALEATPSALDFLNVLAGRGASLKLTVRNTGSGPLNLKSISVPSPFGVVEALPMRIAAGSARVLTVQFSSRAAGSFTGALELASDDPARPSIRIALAGASVGSNTPEIEVTPAALDFGSVTRGKSSELVLRVRNRGPAPLTLKAVSVDAAVFRVSPLATAVTLPAGMTRDLTVTFSPSAAGAVSGNLSLTSDDPKRGTLRAPLKGSGG